MRKSTAEKALEYLAELQVGSCCDCPICIMGPYDFEWLDCWKTKKSDRSDCVKLVVAFCKARTKGFLTVKNFLKSRRTK